MGLQLQSRSPGQSDPAQSQTAHTDATEIGPSLDAARSRIHVNTAQNEIQTDHGK